MLALLTLLLPTLLPGCAPEGPARVVSSTDAYGDEDTAAYDTGGSRGEDIGYEGGTACGDGDTGNDPTGEDVLVLDFCARITPEGDLPDSGPSLDSGDLSDTGLPPPPGGAQPPCGFTNLVGALALAGTAADPVVLYCDADPDGGVRSVLVSRESGVVNSVLSPLDCAADASTGALLPLTDGYGAIWSASDTQLSDTATAGVRMRQLGQEGEPLDA